MNLPAALALLEEALKLRRKNCDAEPGWLHRHRHGKQPFFQPQTTRATTNIYKEFLREICFNGGQKNQFRGYHCMEQKLSGSNDTQTLVTQAVGGDANALATLMDRYRDRLKRMVGLRLDRRLQRRVDASDVVQEALIDAARRLDEYAANPPMRFFLWLRWLTAEKLLNAHRQHLRTKKRDVSQEVSLYRRAMPEACSISLAQQLLGQFTSPTQAVVRAELQLMVQDVLNSMDEIDREVLVLRHFEQLTTTETAQVLNLKRSTASKRYIAALKRLKQVLSATPGFNEQAE